MLTHIHMVVYTWWCWHIYKGMKLELMWINSVKERRQGFKNSIGGVSARRVWIVRWCHRRPI